MIGDVVAAGTPILLVHGVTDNRSIFTVLRRGLRRRGFGRVTTLNYTPLTEDVREVATPGVGVVEAICAETGYERIHVIGHSMGGLVARYYVQRMGGDERVHTVVALGTPHSGTFPARLVPHPVARQMRPGSDVLRSSPPRRRDAGPGSCRSGPTSTSSSSRSGRRTMEHPDLVGAATCSSAA